MKLNLIQVNNFRSIESVTFEVAKIENSQTYTLIGINESGKSSFLKAISLFESDKISYPKDYFDTNDSISISLVYHLDKTDFKKLNENLTKKGVPNEVVSAIDIKQVVITVFFKPDSSATKEIQEDITFKKKLFKEFTYQNNLIIRRETADQVEFDLENYFSQQFSEYFYDQSHKIVFWKSDAKHLINDRINLDSFKLDPENVSVPLLNCFELAGIEEEDISDLIDSIKTDPSEVNNLQERLSDKVTTHIKKVWPDHPVKIKFQITDGYLTFLIEDERVKYKAKTTDQRSDGFKQFISFLLTISAESAIQQLSDTILLLDEPETHLHPRAQEYLRNELIKITQNDNNNIVFYATHSSFMIDREHMQRCYKVDKTSNKKTSLEQIELNRMSYAQVNYEVFDIISNDFHNELYGDIEANKKSKLDGLPKSEKWYNSKKQITESVSLATYIRHSIHHPENTANKKFTDEQLRKSIEILKNI